MGLFDKFKNLFKSEVKKEIKEETKDYEVGLEKTRKEFTSKLNLLTLKYNVINEEYYEELEDILITADIGVNTVMDFIERLRKRVKQENIKNSEELKEIIVDEMFIIYVQNDIIVNKINENKEGPTVILMVGVNGVGKTTTIGKLATKYYEEGKKVLLVAGDTFRAGAIEQLEEWASRSHADIVSGENKDPASVDGREFAGRHTLANRLAARQIVCCQIFGRE